MKKKRCGSKMSKKTEEVNNEHEIIQVKHAHTHTQSCKYKIGNISDYIIAT